MHGPKNLNILKNTKTLDFSSREGGEPPLSHPRASQKLLEVFVRLCASIDRKINKLYENPEKPPNPTEIKRHSSVSPLCQMQVQAISRKTVDRG